MSQRGVAIWVKYVCLGSNNKPLTGDLANHSLYWTADNTRASAVNNRGGAGKHVELGNGLYNILITAAEADCNCGGLDGSSATAGAAIVPVIVPFEYWESLDEMIEADGTNWRFTRNALELGPISTMTITPLTSTVSSGAVSDSNVTIYANETRTLIWTVVDEDGEAVDLSASTLELRGYQPDDPATAVFTVDGANISVSGAEHNQVVVIIDDANTQTARVLRYVIWDKTADAVRARGTLTIVEEIDVA